MANPKRRFSNSRTAKRHSAWKLSSPSISLCPQCRHPKLPHRVCTNCGFYNNSLTLSMAKKEFRQQRKEKKRKEAAGAPPEKEEKKE
ncbi:MAG: 50S ribosomal protein L32 [bacterium]